MQRDVVVGNGQIGVSLLVKLAETERWVERRGTRVHTGCTKAKPLIGSARAARVARTAERNST
jgi:hypothetical protein